MQYARYLKGLLTGDLGDSYRTRNPVFSDIATYLPATVELIFFAFLFALIFALIFAVSSQLRWPGFSLFRGTFFVGSATPSFLLGIFGLLLFYQTWKIFPASDRLSQNPGQTITGFYLLDGLLTGNPAMSLDALHHVLLPSLVLSISPALAIGRVFRSSLNDTVSQDFVRTARSKGMTETQVMIHHVIRNSLNAPLSMIGIQLGFMFSSDLVVENVFAWPGLGSYLGASIPVSDFPAVAGVTFVLGAIYLISNTVVEILQGIADPRIAIR
jgi:peptide/nickel transport system permease protein